MKYAVIQFLGKQHKVAAGDILTVDLVDQEAGKEIEVADVLMKVDGDKVEVGTPLVKGAKVTLKVLEHGKGDKVRVFRYKSKSRYRKTIGHRSCLTNLEVVKLA